MCVCACVFQLHVPPWVLRSWSRSPAVVQNLAWLTGASKRPPPWPRPTELRPAPPSLLTTLQDTPLTPATSGAASQWAAGLSSATRTRYPRSCTPGTQNTSWSRSTGGAREPSTTSTCSSERDRQTAFGIETSSRGRWGRLDVVEKMMERNSGSVSVPLSTRPLVPLPRRGRCVKATD